MDDFKRRIANKTDENTIASIVAYFFAKYSKRALACLGYKNYSVAFDGIAKLVQVKSNFIKLRRDEFDVLIPESPRQGWHKRDIRIGVQKFYDELRGLSFDELALKVKRLIELSRWDAISFDADLKAEIVNYQEKDIEDIINFRDETASVRLVSRTLKERLLDYSIINDLKEFYLHRCQICGKRHYDTFSVHVCEAHHIDHFVHSQNNNASNLIVLCPDHHRIVHVAKPQFERNQKMLLYPNGYRENLMINDHL